MQRAKCPSVKVQAGLCEERQTLKHSCFSEKQLSPSTEVKPYRPETSSIALARDEPDLREKGVITLLQEFVQTSRSPLAKLYILRSATCIESRGMN